MPFFSVVIPTFNRAELLRAAIESVFIQTFVNYEIIVVDDGSTDDTLTFLETLDSRVMVIKQQNRGPGAARNLGVKVAKGEYIAFLDSDDLWFAWTLETYSEVILERGRPAFIAGRPFRFNNLEQLDEVEFRIPLSIAFQDYLASGEEWRWWGVSSFVVRRDAFLSAGGFTDLRINAEDADLALQLGTCGGFVQVIEPMTFGYREHEVSAVKNFSASLAGAQNLIRVEARGGYPGSMSRRMERWRILTRHIRPTALGCLSRGLRIQGLSLYFSTLRWHVALRRWRFLVAFPLLFVLSLFRAHSRYE